MRFLLLELSHAWLPWGVDGGCSCRVGGWTCTRRWSNLALAVAKRMPKVHLELVVKYLSWPL